MCAMWVPVWVCLGRLVCPSASYLLGSPFWPFLGSIFGSPFGAILGPKMGPKMGPKLVQKLLIFGSLFGSLFFEVLELFGCLLGAFLGLLRLSWEASGPKNHEKLICFFKGFWGPEASQESLRRPKRHPKSPETLKKKNKNGPQN